METARVATFWSTARGACSPAFLQLCFYLQRRCTSSHPRLYLTPCIPHPAFHTLLPLPNLDIGPGHDPYPNPALGPEPCPRSLTLPSVPNPTDNGRAVRTSAGTLYSIPPTLASCRMPRSLQGPDLYPNPNTNTNPNPIPIQSLGPCHDLNPNHTLALASASSLILSQSPAPPSLRPRLTRRSLM